jgi:hypothetical protein
MDIAKNDISYDVADWLLPGLVEVLIPRNSTFKLLAESVSEQFEYDFIQIP